MTEPSHLLVQQRDSFDEGDCVAVDGYEVTLLKAECELLRRTVYGPSCPAVGIFRDGEAFGVIQWTALELATRLKGRVGFQMPRESHGGECCC